MISLLLGLAAPSFEAHAGRVESIRAKGFFTCGIWPVVQGFAFQTDGRYSGFEVDLCRAVAAAILGPNAPVQFVIVNRIEQFKAENAIDMVARRLTGSLTHAAQHEMFFGPITFFDGQGFLVPENSGLTSLRDLAGKKICVLHEESHATTLVRYFRERGHDVQAVLVATDSDAQTAMNRGQCVAYSADVSWLGAARAGFVDGTKLYTILPEMISREPIAPLVRRNDDGFFEVVRWTIFALIEAEEREITSANLDEAIKSRSSEVRRFLGLIPGNGRALGLDEAWTRAIVATVGNYGEMFDRNLGERSPIKLDRGLNRLWRDGGLLYAPPVR